MNHDQKPYSVASKAREFWDIWLRYMPRIKPHCHKWLNGNHFHIDDALSLSREKAYHAYVNQRCVVNKPYSWLYRIVYHACIDVHRDQLRHESLISHVEHLPDTFYFSENQSEQLEEKISRDQLAGRLVNSIFELPENLQTVARCRFIDNMGYDEMEQHLHISQTNLRKRIQFSRERLRALAT